MGPYPLYAEANNLGGFAMLREDSTLTVGDTSLSYTFQYVFEDVHTSKKGITAFAFDASGVLVVASAMGGVYRCLLEGRQSDKLLVDTNFARDVTAIRFDRAGEMVLVKHDSMYCFTHNFSRRLGPWPIRTIHQILSTPSNHFVITTANGFGIINDTGFVFRQSYGFANLVVDSLGVIHNFGDPGYKSTDEGQTWIQDEIPLRTSVYLVQCSGDHYIGFNGSFPEVSDGSGHHWRSVPPMAYDMGISGLCVDKHGVIYASGTAGQWRSLDQGRNWRIINATHGAPIVGNDGNLYATDLDSGLIWRSNDMGMTFIRIPYAGPKPKDLSTRRDIFVSRDSEIFILIDTSMLSSTKDFGLHWQTIVVPSARYGERSVAKRGDELFWASDSLYRSTDDGQHWKGIRELYLGVYNMQLDREQNLIFGEGPDFYSRDIESNKLLYVIGWPFAESRNGEMFYQDFNSSKATFRISPDRNVTDRLAEPIPNWGCDEMCADSAGGLFAIFRQESGTQAEYPYHGGIQHLVSMSTRLSVTTSPLLLANSSMGLSVINNPFSDRCSFECKQPLETSALYDLLGREVASSTPTFASSCKQTIETSQLSQGSYILFTRDTEGHTRTALVVKQ